MIVENKAICNKCGDEIFSKHRHDFVTCSCGAISVDGGQEYIRRVGSLSDMSDMSWSLPDNVYFDAIKAVSAAIESSRNEAGIANAVMRVLRAAGYALSVEELRVMASHKDEIMVDDRLNDEVNRYRKVEE